MSSYQSVLHYDEMDIDDDFEKDLLFVSAATLRRVTDCMALVMTLNCFLILIGAAIVNAAAWAPADLTTLPCARELGGSCVTFFSATSDSFVVNYRDFSPTDLCPTSMHCVVSATGASTKLLRKHLYPNATTTTTNTNSNSSGTAFNNATTSPSSSPHHLLGPPSMRFVVSPPMTGFLSTTNSEDEADAYFQQYSPFCRTYGGTTPTPLAWIVVQSFTGMCTAFIVNIIFSIDCVAQRVSWLTAAFFTCLFRFKRCLKRCWRSCSSCSCCCCCGGSGGEMEDGDSSPAESTGDTDASSMDQQQQQQKQGEREENKQPGNDPGAAAAATKAMNDETSSAHFEQHYADSINTRNATHAKFSWVRRAYLVGTPLGLISLLQLLIGIYTAIRFAVASTPDGATGFERYNWGGVAMIGGAPTAPFITIGCLYFTMLGAPLMERTDAMFYEAGCNPIKLFYGLVALGRATTYRLIAPAYATWSRMMRCKIRAAKAPNALAPPKTIIGFMYLYLLATAPWWLTHVLVGFWWFYPTVGGLIGGLLMLLFGGVLTVSYWTVCMRVAGVRTVRHKMFDGTMEEIQVPIYSEHWAVSTFEFVRLAGMQMSLSLLGNYLWSMSTNCASLAYTTPEYAQSENYFRVAFAEMSMRSGSCYIMPLFVSRLHTMSSFSSLF